MKYAIIGGDLRLVELAKILVDEGNTVYTYGLEKCEEIQSNKQIIICNNIVQAVENSEKIISSIPFSNDSITINTQFSDSKIEIQNLANKIKGKTLIAGSIKEDILNYLESMNIKVIDLMKDEKLAILNTIATAEGTIKIIIENTKRNIQNSKILILGYGRVGKTLSSKLKALLANITCASNNKEELAWIQLNGYTYLDLEHVKNKIGNFDIIINTIPHEVLKKEELQNVKKDALLIDLASSPGGIDKKETQKQELNLIIALGLPGKTSPYSTAEYIKELI